MEKIILLCGWFICFYTSSAAWAAAQVDSTAPAFSLQDLKGKSHTLDQYKGKTIVLEWTNYDCPYVRKHYDSGNMQKLQADWTKQGIVWLSINSSAAGKQGSFSTQEWLSRMAQNKAKPTDVLIDADGKVGQVYGAKTTPHIFIIDGKKILRYAGAIDSIPSTDQRDIAKATNYVSAVLTALKEKKTIAEKQTSPYGCSVKY